jgi:glycogen operon protein
MTGAAATGRPQVRPGRRFPLGATPGPGGTNFAVASGVAEGMLLCLFDDAGAETLVALPEYDAGSGTASSRALASARGTATAPPAPGTRPAACAATRPKLLLDPYARATTGPVRFGPEVLGHDLGDPDRASQLDPAGQVPRSLVVDPAFDWPGGARPHHRYADTVVYEVHVKGFTMRHPGVPSELCGAYAGLGHTAALAHLVDLGVTAVELLPVHQHVPEAFLHERGLTNYWGDNTIGFFAPQDGYSAAVRAGRPGGQVAEFQAMVAAMVAALHAAGLEVLLDVVSNHTAEGDRLGPTLCPGPC